METLDEREKYVQREYLKGRLDYFLRDWELKEEDLQGKTIADVGAGQQEFGASALLRSVPVKEILSVDPDYEKGRWHTQGGWMQEGDPREYNYSILPKEVRQRLEQNSYPGIIQELPLKDGSVDMVVMNGLSLDAVDGQRAVSEIHRVLQEKGEARIFPVEYVNGEMTEGSHAFLDMLKQRGLSFETRKHLEESMISREGEEPKLIRHDLLIIRK